MKWFIASDIHGSAYYCEKLLNAYEREKSDRILLLGDILYHGPRNDLPEGYAPKAVIEMLNARKNKILCVRGNCDTVVDGMVLDFPILADYAIICEKDKVIYATHGHIYNEQNPLDCCDVMLCGHTHIPACNEHLEFVYINPGSVSIPKENSHHGYMTLEKGLFLWKDLDGNVIRNYRI